MVTVNVKAFPTFHAKFQNWVSLFLLFTTIFLTLAAEVIIEVDTEDN